MNWFHDDDGSLVLKARLPAEGGAVLLRALQFSRPEDGHRYEAEVRSAGSLAALLDEHERQDLRITPQTAATRWCGELRPGGGRADTQARAGVARTHGRSLASGSAN